MNWTCLQANYFMEVWLSPALGFDFANGTARIFGDGEKALSYISFRDVAKFAVAALDNSSMNNNIIPIGGPRALSPNEVVRVFEEIHGKPFKVEHVPVEALEQ